MSKAKDPVAVAIAIRPRLCTVKCTDGFVCDQEISGQQDCIFFLDHLFKDLRRSRSITTCVVSMFGEVDTYAKKFLSSSIDKGWEEEIDFKAFEKYVTTLGEHRIDPEKVTLLNDATASAHHVFQKDYQKKDGSYPFLLILVRDWGIGFGLVHNKRPWTFGRNSELGHIPAARINLKGIKDVPLNLCTYHNKNNASCIANLVSGKAIKSRNRKKSFREDLEAAGWHKYEFEAFALAQACVVGSAAYSPARIAISASYLNKLIVERIKEWFGALAGEFPKRSADFIKYVSTLDDADIEGAFTYAQEISGLEFRQQTAPKSKW